MDILIAIVCVLLGVVLGFVFKQMQTKAEAATIEEKLRTAELERAAFQKEIRQAVADRQELAGQLGEANGRLQIMQQEFEKKTATIQDQATALTGAKEAYTMVKVRFDAAEEKLTSQKTEFDNLSNIFRNEFRLLAGGILEEKTLKFTQVNQENMKMLLDPLQAHLKDFKLKVEETYDKESKERFSLERELKVLVELNKQLGEEANNLTHALKITTRCRVTGEK
jgi:DNA recombination protein RmuC